MEQFVVAYIGHMPNAWVYGLFETRDTAEEFIAQRTQTRGSRPEQYLVMAFIPVSREIRYVTVDDS